METERPFASCDRANLVPFNKEPEQAGRTEEIGECAQAFDRLSEDPIPPSQYQSRLRSDSKAHLGKESPRSSAVKAQADKGWAGDNGRDRSVAFDGVGGKPGLDEGIETGIGAGALSIVREEYEVRVQAWALRWESA